MIEVFRLTKRHVDPAKKEKMPHELEQVKVFSLVTGHGIGSVDFVEQIDGIDDAEYQRMLDDCGEYARFKLSNLSKYFEVEIFPEHIVQLLPEMPESTLKSHLLALKDGYIILRKSL